MNLLVCCLYSFLVLTFRHRRHRSRRGSDNESEMSKCSSRSHHRHRRRSHSKRDGESDKDHRSHHRHRHKSGSSSRHRYRPLIISVSCVRVIGRLQSCGNSALPHLSCSSVGIFCSRKVRFVQSFHQFNSVYFHRLVIPRSDLGASEITRAGQPKIHFYYVLILPRILRMKLNHWCQRKPIFSFFPYV